MKRTDKMKNIAISKQESYEMTIELETIFCRADRETGQGEYSLRNIKRKYPNICALYFAISEP